MARAPLPLFAVAVAATSCMLILTAGGAAASRGDGLSSFSNRGVAIDLARLSARQRAVVRGAGFGEIRRLSRTEMIRNGPYVGRWYWYVGSVSGRTCFARAFVEQGRAEFSPRAALSPFGCRGAGAPRARFLSLASFPSRERPLADASGFGAWSAGDRVARVALLCGLAADAVRAVGIMRRNGTLLTSPVRGNTYCLTRIGTTLLAKIGAQAIVALDGRGRRVYSRRVEGPPATRRRTPLPVTYLKTITPAGASGALGQRVLWPGPRVAGVPLYDVQLLRVAARSDRGRVTHRHALHFRYLQTDWKPRARVTLRNRRPWLTLSVGSSWAHTPLGTPSPKRLRAGVLTLRRDAPTLWVGHIWREPQRGKRPLFFVFSSSHRRLVVSAARALREMPTD